MYNMAATSSGQAKASANNRSWFGNAMKSIGNATVASFKSIAPNITSTGAGMYAGGKKVKSSLRPANLVSIGRDLTRNKYVKMARNSLIQSKQDIKSGKFYNPDRADEAMMRSMGLGDMDDFSAFGDSEDGGGDTFIFGNTDDGGDAATVALTGAVVQSSETTLAVGNAIIDSNMGISSAVISELQSGFGEMSKQMETMNATLSAILQFHNENTSKFYQDTLSVLSSIRPPEPQASFSFGSDPMDIFNSGGSINTSAYKDYVKNRMKSVVSKSPAGMILPFLTDDSVIEEMLADPVGGITKSIVSSMIPAVAQQTMREVDKTFGEFIPNMMMEMGKWATDPKKGKFQQILGEIFGLHPSGVSRATSMAEVTKDAAVFDNITRNTLVEVLPKYARESTAYLKEIALHVTKKDNEQEILSQSDVFDAKQNKYVKQSDLQKNFMQDMMDQIKGAFTGSNFGDALQNIGNQLSGKDKEAYDKTFDQFIARLATTDKNLTERDYNTRNKNSEINKLLKGIGGKRRDKDLLKQAIQYLYDNNQTIETAARAQQEVRASWNNRIKDMSENYDAYNLHALGINNDTDIVELFNNYQKEQGNRLRRKGSRRGTIETTDGSNKSMHDIVSAGAKDWQDTYDRREAQSGGGMAGVIFGNDFGQGFKEAGGHAINAMHAAMKGDSRAAIQEFGSIFTSQMKNMWDGAKTHFLEPLGKKLFGKDDDGNAIGLFANAQNKMSDTYKATLQKINGKSYTDSKGELIEAEPGTSLVDKASEIFANVKDSVKGVLFGEEGEDGEKKSKGILGNAREMFTEGLKGWKDAVFGESDDPDAEIQKVKDKIKEHMPSAIAGGAGGALLGAVGGGSLLGMAIGGPVGGAILGFAGSFVAKSDKFKDYVFGPEIEDTDENGNTFKRRVGGLVSANAQKMFKDNKNSIIGGAALGTIKSMIFGGPGGLLGTLVGGPIGGALIGAGLGMVKKSETFQKFLYGDEESGKDGIVTSFKKMFSGGKSGGDAEASKDDMKALGMGVTGAAGGAFSAALISKVGILGAMATPFGPLGGAIAGAAVGIAAGSKKFRTFLFGEKDKETGETTKNGLFQKFGNYLHVEMLAPMKSKVLDIVDDMKITLKYDILETVRLPFSIMADRIHESIGNAKEFLHDKVGGAIMSGYEHFVKPVADVFTKHVLDPARKVISKGVDIMYNFAKMTITAPFRLVRHIGKVVTSPIRKGISKLGKMVFGGVRKLFGFAGAVVKTAFSPVSKLAKSVFGGIGDLATGIKDRINTGKEGGGIKGAFYKGMSKLTSSEWRKGDYANQAEKAEAKRQAKVDKQKRRITDENRRRIARVLGYDVKYFTEENMQAALAAAQAQGKKLKLRKGKGGDYGFEDDPKEVARKEKMKKSTAEMVKNGEHSDDMEVRMLTEAHRTNERLAEIADLLRQSDISDEERADLEEEQKDLKNEQQERVDEAARAGLEYDPETGEVRAADDSSGKKKKTIKEMMNEWSAKFEEAGGVFSYAKKNFFNMDSFKEGFNNSWLGSKLGRNRRPFDGTDDLSPADTDEVREMFDQNDHARAKGGSVKKGEPYLVGEESPEIVVPDSAGTVLSQRGGGIKAFITGFDHAAIDSLRKIVSKGDEKPGGGNAAIAESESTSIKDKLRPRMLGRMLEQRMHARSLGYDVSFPGKSKKEASKEKTNTDSEEPATDAPKLDTKEEKSGKILDKLRENNTYTAMREAADKKKEEEEDDARDEESLSTLKDIKAQNAEHHNVWSKIFSKKGLLTLALTAAGGLVLTHLPQISEAIPKVVDVVKSIWDGACNLATSLSPIAGTFNDFAGGVVSKVIGLIPGMPDLKLGRIKGDGPLAGFANVALAGLYIKGAAALASGVSAVISAGKSVANTATTLLGDGSKVGKVIKYGSMALAGYSYLKGPEVHDHTDAAGNEIIDTDRTRGARSAGTKYAFRDGVIRNVERVGGVNRQPGLLKRAGNAIKGTKKKIGEHVASKLATESTGSIANVRNAIAGEISAKLASNADDVAGSKGAMGFIKKCLTGVKNFLMKNKVVAKFGKTIASKIDDLLLTIGKASDKIVSKMPSKIAAIITKGTAQDSVGAGTAGISYAVMAFGGALSGGLSAANIFGVRESDVNATMRTIASVIVAMLNGVPLMWALELVDFFIAPITFRGWICELLYKLLGGGDDLEEKRATFSGDLDAYNTKYGAELDTDEYNDLVNKSAFAKIFGKGAVKTDENGRAMFDEAGAAIRTNHGIAGWFSGGQKVYEHNADGSVARDENGKAIQAIDQYGRKQVEKKTWTDHIGDGIHGIGRFFAGGDVYETDENGNAIRDENGNYKVKSHTGNIFERGADWWNKNKIGDKLNPVKNAKKVAAFGKWLISSESEEVYTASDGSYYNAKGEHFNANGESLKDKIDLETLSAWVSSGMLNPEEKMTKEAGIVTIGKGIKKKLKQGWDKALELKDKAVDAFVSTGKKVGNKLLSIGTAGVRLFKHKEKVLMLNDGSGYYGINNGEFFNKYSMSGDIIEENIPREDVLAMQDSGLLTEETIKVDGTLKKKLKKLASAGWNKVLDLKDKVISGAKELGAKAASKAKEIAIGGARLISHKEKVWMLKNGDGYYRVAGDGSTWEKCNADGDVIGDPISAEEMQAMVDSQLVTEGTVKVDGTIKKRIKGLFKLGGETFGKLLDVKDELFAKIGEATSPFIDSIKEKGLGATIIGAFKTTKKKGWYLIDGTGYYVMASSGKYEFFSMNGDKVESKTIDASKMQELIDAGLVKEGDIIEDSAAKQAIDKIQGAVKDAWNSAKNVVTSGWEKFKKYIGGSGNNDKVSTVNGNGLSAIGNLAQTAANKASEKIGGKGAAKRSFYGGRGETQNNFAYYSQEDPAWADKPYVSGMPEDEATMGDTGCAPTAMAMVATEISKRKGSGSNGTNPVEMANLASTSGFRDETGTNEQFISYAGNTLGIRPSEHIAPSAEDIQYSAMRGNPMILNGISSGESGSAFTNVGHYVVVAGTDSAGNISVNDPRGKQYSKSYKPEELARQTRKAWDFGGSGGFRFGKKWGKKRKMGGRGVSGDWLSIVRSVKALVAEQKPTYNQGGSMTINYNGQNITLRPDCSGLVGCMLQIYGAIPPGTNVTSRSLLSDGAIPEGFTKGGWPGWEGLQEGDIITRSGHVEIFANNNGGHNVYNGGSTSALGSPGPTPTGHSQGYDVVWRPGNAGTGAGAVSGSAGGATVSNTPSGNSSGGFTDMISKAGNVFTKFASKAMQGMMTGNWDFDFSDTDASASSSGGTSTGATMDTNVSGNDVKEQTWNWMTSHGWSKEATAAIMGNMEQESGVNPTAIQRNGKGPAAGIVQWENYNTRQGRFANMEAFAKSQGKEWTDLGSQLAFMTQEMHDTTNGYYPKLGGMSADELMQSTDINAAVMAFRRGFERCKDEHANDSRRLSAAQSYYNMYKNNTTSSGGNVGTSGGFGGAGKLISRFGGKSGDSGVSGAIPDTNYGRLYDSITSATPNVNGTNVQTLDTKSLEQLLNAAIKVLQSIDANTSKLDGLNVSNANVNNGGNVTVVNGGNSVQQISPEKRNSTNAALAQMIAKG